MATMTLKNATLISLGDGARMQLGDVEAEIGIDPAVPGADQSVKYALGTHSGSFTAELDPEAYAGFATLLPKQSPALDAVVDWDPWRNPRAFWSLMTSLLVRGGPGTRWRIRQATAADRLKGGALA